jgi:mRNA interferase MazF
LRRGEIWTVSGGKDYAGKPRPAVIIQDDRFDGTDSITICGFTRDSTDTPLFRLPVEPSVTNGLSVTSRIMVDKVTTVPRSKIGSRVGRLGAEDMVRLNRAVLVFLGIAELSAATQRC